MTAFREFLSSLANDAGCDWAAMRCILFALLVYIVGYCIVRAAKAIFGSRSVR